MLVLSADKTERFAKEVPTDKITHISPSCNWIIEELDEEYGQQ